MYYILENQTSFDKRVLSLFLESIEPFISDIILHDVLCQFDWAKEKHIEPLPLKIYDMPDLLKEFLSKIGLNEKAMNVEVQNDSHVPEAIFNGIHTNCNELASVHQEINIIDHELERMRINLQELVNGDHSKLDSDFCNFFCNSTKVLIILLFFLLISKLDELFENINLSSISDETVILLCDDLISSNKLSFRTRCTLLSLVLLPKVSILILFLLMIFRLKI